MMGTSFQRFGATIDWEFQSPRQLIDEQAQINVQEDTLRARANQIADAKDPQKISVTVAPTYLNGKIDTRHNGTQHFSALAGEDVVAFSNRLLERAETNAPQLLSAEERETLKQSRAQEVLDTFKGVLAATHIRLEPATTFSANEVGFHLKAALAKQLIANNHTVIAEKTTRHADGLVENTFTLRLPKEKTAFSVTYGRSAFVPELFGLGKIQSIHFRDGATPILNEIGRQAPGTVFASENNRLDMKDLGEPCTQLALQADAIVQQLRQRKVL
ncbi:MAG: hypothetical protein SFZ03_10755 [Candidatus Melainabacteria bacterium]|nr:hypothetical protein [Candidatus Melainabacteria bacterium]